MFGTKMSFPVLASTGERADPVSTMHIRSGYVRVLLQPQAPGHKPRFETVRTDHLQFPEKG